MADFSREAPSLVEAIASAARDIDKVSGLRAVGVQCDNMVTLLDIAKRAGVSRLRNLTGRFPVDARLVGAVVARAGDPPPPHWLKTVRERARTQRMCLSLAEIPYLISSRARSLMQQLTHDPEIAGIDLTAKRPVHGTAYLPAFAEAVESPLAMMSVGQ